MGGWGCPHEVDGKCQKVNDLPCNPGMKGCVLFGRFVWADESKNRPTPRRGGTEPENQAGENNSHRGSSDAD